MARALSILGLTAALLLSSAGWDAPAQAKVAPEAEAILQMAVETMGGDAAVAAVKGMRMTARGRYGDQAYRTVMVWLAPDRLYWSLDTGMFKASMGLDRGTPWSAFLAPPARLAGGAKESVLNWRDHQDVLLIRPLLHRDDIEIEKGPSEKDGEKAREHILLTFANGMKLDLVFLLDGGRATLVFAEGDMIHMDGRRGTMKWTLRDHRKFGDVRMPTSFHMRTFVGEKQIEEMTEEVVSCEWNPEVPDDLFRMPKLELPLDRPNLVKAPAMRGIALIHEGPYEKLPESFRKMWDLVARLQLMPRGPMVVTYLVDPSSVEDPAELRSEVFVPLVLMGREPKLPEGFSMKDLPGAEVAHMVKKGPYGQVEAESIGRLAEWLEQHGHEMIGPPRVLYYHEPDGVVPEDQISEAQIPVRIGK
jgi:effector-binding domain-containing protein